MLQQRGWMHLKVAIIVLMIGTVFTSSVYAENGEDEFTLQEITVTAEKKEASLQKTPLAITAVTGEDIREKGLVSVADVLKDVPGVVVQGARRGYVIAIRGLGSDLPPSVGESAVTTNYDGVYNFRNETGTFGYYDLNRVEVLRGPQGTLYGRNATGGVVNVVSKDPTDEIGGYGTVEIGSDKLLRTEGAVNLPMSETVATRLAFVNVNRDGFISNGSDDAVGSAARLKVKYKPKEDVKILLFSEFSKLGGHGPGSITEDGYNSGVYISNASENTSQNYTSYKLSANVEFPAGPGVVTFIPSYQNGEGTVFADRGTDEGMTKDLDPKDVNQYSAELRYSAKPDETIQWVSGLYYYYLHNSAIEVGPVANPHADPSITNDYTKAYAAFGQVTYPFADSFRLIAGLRFGYDDKSYEDNHLYSGSDDTSGQNDWTTLDWKLGLEADLSENVLTYITLASGHRPGGFNNLTTTDVDITFDQEDLVSAELGMKSRFMSNRLQLNGNIFYYDYNDFQVSDFYLDAGQGVTLLMNVESVLNYGAEVEAEVLFSANTIGKFSATYLHARYDSDFILHDFEAVNMNGKPLPHAPDWTLNGSLNHSFVLSDGSAITPSVTVRWTDDQYVAPFNGESQFQPAYTTVDANISYAAPSNRWNVNAYVKNATDEMVKNAYFIGEVLVGSPRQIGVILTVKY